MADLSAWPTLFALAIADGDDHVIKLTWAAWAEHQIYPSPWYQYAVAQMFIQQHAEA